MTNAYRDGPGLSSHKLEDVPAAFPPGGSLLERVEDIPLAEVLAAHQRTKHGPEAFKDKAESEWTDADRRAWRAHVDRIHSGPAGPDWREVYPCGGDLDGFEYNSRWRKVTIHMVERHKPDMAGTVRWCTRHWPEVRRIVVNSGETPCMNYVKTHAADEDGRHVKGVGWWRALRPGDLDYVY